MRKTFGAYCKDELGKLLEEDITAEVENTFSKNFEEAHAYRLVYEIHVDIKTRDSQPCTVIKERIN